jgi:hypothetical protein
VDNKDLYFRQISVGFMGISLSAWRQKEKNVGGRPAWDVDAVLTGRKDGMKVVGDPEATHFDHMNGVEELVRENGVYVHEMKRSPRKNQREPCRTQEGSSSGSEI